MLTDAERDAQWVCAFCGRNDFPVPSMARDHEKRCVKNPATAGGGCHN